ncbi:hypothetical protein [Gemmatimonas groenlandica]|uniref:Uncharacterized protein n=1 Tax=Gemmatimonas groenlandica TaxID=2732249 RepID=A0A6M4INP9_9BACT|nr:hypothetical protein [Gemmatimonas groenlandica]QJR36353.1 hypothetical protein HKW67_12975 [Gemmatimonas groenlandica]
MPTAPMTVRALSRVTALLAALVPAVSRAQHMPHDPAADSARYHLGTMATGLLTTANPALLGRRYTEGYLTQPNVMGDAAWGALRFTGTLNFEGYTLRRGELNAGMYGEGYADRRHPHTLVHEAMLAVATPARAGFRATLAGGKGFTPYGTDDPMMRPFVKYPVNHHHAQIIERVLVMGAVQVARGDRAITLEQSWFNGDEPVGPFTGPQWSRVGDSRSTRLTVSPLPSLEAGVSSAFVRSPGLTQGGAFDHRQLSSSLRYDVPAKRYALLEIARTDESLGTQRVFRFASVLVESSIVHRGWALSARAENTDRPESERLLDLFRTPNGHVDFQLVGITRWSIGTVQLAAPGTGIPRLRGTHLTPFVEVARAHARAQRTPAVFVPAEFYGSDTQWSLSIGARVHAGTMRRRMGRYVFPTGSSPAHTHPT